MKITPTRQEFTAILQQHENLDASYITVPFNVFEIYGTKGNVKITCTFDGHAYRGSLAPMGTGQHILIVVKAIRKAIGKTFGDEIEVIIQPDLAPRTVTLPSDLAALLDQHPEIKNAFEKLAYTHRKEYVTWIEEAKKPETRLRRLEKMAEKLLIKPTKVSR